MGDDASLLFGRLRRHGAARPLPADGVPAALGARALELQAVLVERQTALALACGGALSSTLAPTNLAWTLGVVGRHDQAAELALQLPADPVEQHLRDAAAAAGIDDAQCRRWKDEGP